jgi:integrase/recombinase XerD
VKHLPENHSGATSDAQLVDLWLAGRPESTQSVYRPVVTEFLGFISKGLQEAVVADLVRWVETLPGADTTRYRKVSTVKSLLTYAHRTGYTVFNIGLPVLCPRPLNRLHEKILEQSEVQEVIGKAEAGRNRTLTKFLYASGARITEACKLRFTDVRGNRVSFFGKGRKTRTIIIPMELADELRALRQKGDTDHSHVFKSVTGKPLLARNARQVIGKAADEAALKMSPHWLRHAHASHALDNGAPIHVVQQGLGHENVSTTSLYLHARPNDGASRYLNL